MKKKNKLGKVLAKKRLDKEIVMKDMARDLGISLSFLGHLEVGNNPIPDDILLKLLHSYEWTKNEKIDLIKAYAVQMGRLPLFLMKNDEQRVSFLEDSALMFLGRLS